MTNIVPSIKAGPSDSDSFQREATEVAGRIREPLARVIERVCGTRPRPHDVSDGFGVHPKLGWQLWHLTYTDDPLSAMRYLPGRKSLDTWHTAAMKQGIDIAQIDAVLDACASFERLVRTHAPDREMLEMMLESSALPIDEKAEQRWRSQAFRGNTFIFGGRARTMLATIVLNVSERPGFFDMVKLNGLIGFMRTRPNLRWPFAQSVIYSGTEQRDPLRRPLAAPVLNRTGVPLLEQHCSDPLPPVERRVSEAGMLEDDILPGPVGQTGAADIVTAEIGREVAPVYRTHEGEEALFGTGIRTPSETLLMDHIVHRDLFGPVQRTLRVFSELVNPTTRDPRDVLEISEKLVHIGSGIRGARTPDVPGYRSMLELIFSETGWDPDQFDIYRVRMSYPPIPTSVMVHHALPTPPDGWQGE